MFLVLSVECRSQLPRGLRRRSSGRSPAEIVVSNPTGGMDVVVSVVCCQRSLRRIDYSSRGVLPTVARRCVWSSKLEYEEAKNPLPGCENTTTVGCNAKKTNNKHYKQRIFCCSLCLEKCRDKILNVFIHIFIHSSFFVLNFVLPACRQNLPKFHALHKSFTVLYCSTFFSIILWFVWP